MKPPSLIQFFESLPARGGEAEELRQKRILQSIDSEVNSLREHERCELRRLNGQQSLTLEERRELHYLSLKYPEEVSN